jgi:hypothetical protein
VFVVAIINLEVPQGREFFEQHNDYLQFKKHPTAVSADNEIIKRQLKFFFVARHPLQR